MDSKEWIKGDLLFYNVGADIGHVSVYIGDGKILQSSESMGGVVIPDYNYNGHQPVRARRIIPKNTYKGWYAVDGNWYYYGNAGTVLTGWVQDDGKWYCFNASGYMKTGWLQLGSTWYYLSSSGTMVTGEVTIDGRVNVFNSSGVWLGYK